MTDDGKGNLYICNFGKGLCVFDTKGHTTKNFSMRDKDMGKGVLCNDWIKALFVDKDDLLWIGTTNGVSVMDTKDFNFNVIKMIDSKTFSVYLSMKRQTGKIPPRYKCRTIYIQQEE